MQPMQKHTPNTAMLFLFLVLLLSTYVSGSPAPDALALLSFKSKTDPHNRLHFTLTNRTEHEQEHDYEHCKWAGVTCAQRRVVRLVLEGLTLTGSFPNKTLSRLDQLRVLSLQNNSLTGPLPTDLSHLLNLKSLFLDHNNFSGSFPRSILTLHRLRAIDLSHNTFTGRIPFELVRMDRMGYLRLDSNRFDGAVPPLNQSDLAVFNVSANNLTGAVPVTAALSRFNASVFSGNLGLCGEIVRKECGSRGLPFFDYDHDHDHAHAPAAQPSGSVGQSEQIHGVVLGSHSSKSVEDRKKRGMIIGCSVFALFLVIGCVMRAIVLVRRKGGKAAETLVSTDSASAAAAEVMRVEEEDELGAKVKQMQGIQLAKSGTLVFCAGEAQVYSLDQLMRASAELLGRGSFGSTYKAVLDNHLIVTVKRLDAVKTSVTSREVFERYMESVGCLRHPNLVPLRSFFQAKEERLIIYDYQANGSLFSLVHGSRSARSKPLHWTSCLKIAEDVAQGLAYIHQASRLVHGNLKSSNILLGADFEACLTDYCLSALANSSREDTDHCGYAAPETRKCIGQTTPKSDVYSFGVLLLELLTGKLPSQQPFLLPEDLLSWVRSVREVEIGDENRVAMLLELATTCSVTSPEQRPTMWLVLKMIQEIKENVMLEDSEMSPSSTGYA
ncbi:hypothetical protein Sjap_017334 [Stephania japonica]|uniref:Protein kinase domain-containing protein n=1 Tax=Stephania japonica TaxID=461633 RepID=A0AAP0I5Z2_9MAGN